MGNGMTRWVYTKEWGGAYFPPLAAIGYSLVYMLFGGGIFGAAVIFFIAKAFGK
jgi:hypothetical protein